MKIKVQCDGFIHEFEGAYVYTFESSGKVLEVHSSKSGEYHIYKNFLGLNTRGFNDCIKVASFKKWDAVIIEGEEDVKEDRDKNIE